MNAQIRTHTRALALLAALLVLLALCALPARADGSYIYDTAGLLSEGERQELENRAAALSQQLQCGIYIATVEDYRDYGSGSIDAVAEGIYKSNGFGLYNDASGVFLLLSMADRDYYVYTNGFATYSLNGSTLTRLENGFLDNFRNNDWYGGFLDYVEGCGSALGSSLDSWEQGQESGGPDLGFALVVGVIVGCVVALIACSVMKAKMKSVAKARTAQVYAVPGGMDLYESSDVFSHITESRVKVESDSDRGGGGGSRPSGGSGGHGGKF